MMIHDITAVAGKYKARKRIGRGRGSGVGKTSGRGHNGAASRAGYSRKPSFEGGQMPYFRRIPKRGFTNANFMTHFRIVNLRSIVEHQDFAKGGDINATALEASGLIPTGDEPIKILGDLGEAKSLKITLNVDVARVTASVRKHVEDAGGTINEQGTRRDRVRGIERNTGSEDPTKLTKKRKRWKKREKAKAQA